MEKVKTLSGFLHTWLEFIIVLGIGSLFYYVFKFGSIKSDIIGVIAAAIAGLLKEFLWDKKLKRGVFSINDLLADFMGTAAGFVFGLLLFCNTSN